jgi:hypothetical protein
MNKDKELLEQWVNIVFNEGEHTCMGHKFQNKIFKVDKLFFRDSEYVSINPMIAGRTRSGSNVTHFRTFLIEVDQDEHGKSVEKKTQIEQIVKNAKMPWSAMTDSANKSVHFLITLEEALDDRPIYTAYFQAIQTVLKKYGIVIDGACKDPGRFTRAPFGINCKTELIEKKPDANDRVQRVLRLNKRIKLKDLDYWLEQNGVNVEDFIKIPVNVPTFQVVSDAPADWKLQVIEKNYMRNEKFEQGNKNNYQYKLAWLMYGAGCTNHEIRTAFMNRFGEIDHRDPITSAEKSATKCNPIYIATKEEIQQYYKQQDEINKQNNRKSAFERDGVKPESIGTRPEDASRYFTVGTEYFKIASDSDKILPWSKSMFEKIYGGNAIPERMYDQFGYQPDYLSDTMPIELGEDRKKYNMFIRPDWKLAEGDWSTIKGALEHGFGEQYDLALQYCAILIAFPEAKLPAIWFLGPENKGKSAVIAIFRYLLGDSVVKKISSRILESDYTDFLGASQLVIVEEAGGWKNPDAVMNNLKDWITEVAITRVNPKYGKQFDSPINAKFIFSSNNSDAIPLTGAASRIWVRVVDQDPKNPVSNYYVQIQKEMGHFAYYLKNHVVPNLRLAADGSLDTSESRLYFKASEYETEAKVNLKTFNHSAVYEDLSTEVMDFFGQFPEENECYIDLKSIKTRLKYTSIHSPGNKDIKKCLVDEFNLPTSSRPLTRPDHFNWKHGALEDYKPERRSQWFCFQRSEFYKDGEELVQSSYIQS